MTDTFDLNRPKLPKQHAQFEININHTDFPKAVPFLFNRAPVHISVPTWVCIDHSSFVYYVSLKTISLAQLSRHLRKQNRMKD